MSTMDLFDLPTASRPTRSPIVETWEQPIHENNVTRELGQYMTPRWAAQELVDQFYPDLDRDDLVVEPSCGTGSFLQAIPDEVTAVGVELDPNLAKVARKMTGRRVLDGDFRTIDLSGIQPTLVLGNPPFQVKLITEFIERAYQLLPDNGRCGLLMSVHAIQTPSTVLRWGEKWSIDQRLVPRTLFPRAIRPLVFLMMTKDQRRSIAGGFALYHAAAAMAGAKGQVRLLLVEGAAGKPCWRAVVEWAIRQCGGKASLDELYAAIEPKRPTANPFWREKIRQTLQRHFAPAERGVWQLKDAA